MTRVGCTRDACPHRASRPTDAARDEIADLLDDNPSIKSVLDEVMASAYRYARRKAAIETEKAEEAFPAQCPWPLAQALDAAFWPGQRPNHSGQNSASAA